MIPTLAQFQDYQSPLARNGVKLKGLDYYFHQACRLKTTIDEIIGPIELANQRDKLIHKVSQAASYEELVNWGRDQVRQGFNPGLYMKRKLERLKETKSLKTLDFLADCLKKILLTITENWQRFQECSQPKDESEPLGPYKFYAVAANIYKFLDHLATHPRQPCSYAEKKLSGSDDQILEATEDGCKNLRELYLNITDNVPKIPIKILRSAPRSLFSTALVQANAWFKGYRPNNH